MVKKQSFDPAALLATQAALLATLELHKKRYKVLGMVPGCIKRCLGEFPASLD